MGPELVAGPLSRLGLPMERLGFQLLLALRFLPLVQEELQNLLRSLASRAVNLRRLGFKASFGLVLAVGERLLANILLRAEQGADALVARGGMVSVLPASTAGGADGSAAECTGCAESVGRSGAEDSVRCSVMEAASMAAERYSTTPPSECCIGWHRPVKVGTSTPRCTPSACSFW